MPFLHYNQEKNWCFVSSICGVQYGIIALIAALILIEFLTVDFAMMAFATMTQDLFMHLIHPNIVPAARNG